MSKHRSDEQFRIEDLEEWLKTLAINNEYDDDYCNCVYDIISRLPGFIEYAREKKAGVYE